MWNLTSNCDLFTQDESDQIYATEDRDFRMMSTVGFVMGDGKHLYVLNRIVATWTDGPRPVAAPPPELAAQLAAQIAQLQALLGKAAQFAPQPPQVPQGMLAPAPAPVQPVPQPAPQPAPQATAPVASGPAWSGPAWPAPSGHP